MLDVVLKCDCKDKENVICKIYFKFKFITAKKIAFKFKADELILQNNIAAKFIFITSLY